jgi:hypothetical protein
MTKDSGLRIRVQRDLRDDFLNACRAEDKPAAQVIREFMRRYVDSYRQAASPPPTRSARQRRGQAHEH